MERGSARQSSLRGRESAYGILSVHRTVVFQEVFHEPVWPSGKALGWQAEGPRFESASALLSLQKLGSVDTVL